MTQSVHPRRQRRNSNCCPCHLSATWPSNKQTIPVSTEHPELAGQSPWPQQGSCPSTLESWCWLTACVNTFPPAQAISQVSPQPPSLRREFCRDAADDVSLPCANEPLPIWLIAANTVLYVYPSASSPQISFLCLHGTQMSPFKQSVTWVLGALFFRGIKTSPLKLKFCLYLLSICVPSKEICLLTVTAQQERLELR